MADCMSAAEYCRRAEECAAVLREVADSKRLGDGTNETWVCGIASGLLKELLERGERCVCVECRHYERVNGRIVSARCRMTNISFTKFRHDIAPIDPSTFYCRFADRKEEKK